MSSKSSSSHPASSSASTSGNSSKFPPAKPANVFSNDGSFLDRIRRSMKEDEEKLKEKEALERKRQFADRFKNRGKRSAPTADPNVNDNKDIQDLPNKKAKLAEDVDKQDSGPSPQDYHKAIGSYAKSLKENGTGIRPLVK